MRAGQRVGSRYRIGRLLGSGGAGEVYAAVGPDRERAAIKFLREEIAHDPDIVARFQREADFASRIRSPHVASLLRAGRTRDGSLWIAFELLEGEGLDARIRRVGRMRASDLGPIIDHVLQGLSAAHRVHVIHRDIKPANIFLERSGRAKILDFGVGKASASSTETGTLALTALDETLGSLSFMPPEQVGGAAHVDERADLYATGVVAFLALAGRLPFGGAGSAAQLQYKARHEPLTLAEATNDDWPEGAESFFRTILARSADARFASADEALDGWRRVSALSGFPSMVSKASPAIASDNDTDASPPSRSEFDDSTTRD